MVDGVLTHDFDPAYAPDGRIVFASTRRGRRTAAALQPNADLYVLEAGGTVRGITFLNNQELAPSFMADGRVIFTTEKRAEGFHQLAGRRQNLDGGDYHPLYAQRTSIGFDSATEVIELANRNFAATAGPVNAPDGAGTIAIANRSIGVDQSDRDPGDRYYIHSLRMPLSAGVFRSPAAMPGGRFVASCNLGTTDPMAANIDWDLCEVDPHNGTASRLFGAAGRAEVEAVGLYARPDNGVFVTRLDEPNGAVRLRGGGDTTAELHIQDFPLLATLLFQNTRTGRPLDSRIAGFDVLVAEPTADGATLNRSDDLG